jgi:hypothetical protein
MTVVPTHLQTGDFHGGIFEIVQDPAERGLTELVIRDNVSRGTACTHSSTGTVSRQIGQRVLGLLRGSAEGSFRTTGAFAAATVRGTQWGVRDRCDGTLVIDTAGVVDVHDFRLNKTIRLYPGQTYLARAP